MGSRRSYARVFLTLTLLSASSLASTAYGDLAKQKKPCALFFKKLEEKRIDDDLERAFERHDAKQFEHFPPETTANRRPRYQSENLREIEVPQLAALELPKGFSVSRVYKSNAAGSSKEKVYQVVVGKGDRDAAQITAYYDPETKGLSISTMETQSDFRENGLGKALLKSVDLITNGEAKSVHFAIVKTNQAAFDEALDRGATLEKAIGETPIGRGLRDLGFRLKKVSVPRPLVEQRPVLASDPHADTSREAGSFYFWLER